MSLDFLRFERRMVRVGECILLNFSVSYMFLGSDKWLSIILTPLQVSTAFS